LKIENLRIVPAKPGTTQVKAVATPANPGPLAPKPARPATKLGPNPAGMRQSVAGEDRRRSQRVLLRVHANLHLVLHDKNTTFEVTTLSVNDCGALVVLPRSLPLDTHLVLEHNVTKKRVMCKVARSPREMPEGFHIPLEFDTPEPNFWGIAFPPSDWRPPDDF
jgi:hypothetical protein